VNSVGSGSRVALPAAADLRAADDLYARAVFQAARDYGAATVLPVLGLFSIVSLVGTGSGPGPWRTAAAAGAAALVVYFVVAPVLVGAFLLLSFRFGPHSPTVNTRRQVSGWWVGRPADSALAFEEGALFDWNRGEEPPNSPEPAGEVYRISLLLPFIDGIFFLAASMSLLYLLARELWSGSTALGWAVLVPGGLQVAACALFLRSTGPALVGVSRLLVDPRRCVLYGWWGARVFRPRRDAAVFRTAGLRSEWCRVVLGSRRSGRLVCVLRTPDAARLAAAWRFSDEHAASRA